MSSQKRGIAESAPSQLHGRASVDAPLRTPFPTEGIRIIEEGLRNKSSPRMMVTTDAAQSRLERLDFLLMTALLHEVGQARSSSGSGVWYRKL